MKKICKQCSSEFEVADGDLEFLGKVAPVFAGQKFNIPEPNICYKCRLQRRFSWRNDITLYKTKCAKTGAPLISMFAPDSGITVYEHDFWWSDKWDARDYGRDFDFSRPFLSSSQSWKRRFHMQMQLFLIQKIVFTQITIRTQ